MSKNFPSDAAHLAEDSFDRLLKRAVDGDEAAVNELVEGLRPYLLLIANQHFDRELQGKIAPSDLVQSALFAAQKNLPQFRGESVEALRSWVKTILKNNLIDARRKYLQAAKRNSGKDIKLDSRLVQTVSDSTESPSTATANQEKTVLLQQAIACLPDNHRQIIRMRNWEQLGFVEIANQLGLTEDGARKLWARAIKNLASVVKSRFPGLDSIGIETDS
ncbi:MAG: sigma-70 family RNA polymerase sigma factor [Pirellulaceae bacterium]